MKPNRLTTHRADFAPDPHPDCPIQTQDLFETDFYQFRHWCFDLLDAGGSHKGYNDCFCLVFVHQGWFAAEQAKAYLNQEFNRDLSLLDLADHCCVSLFHLSRLFKACTGYSPHQYLLTARLTHAQRLLRNTAMPVTEVSYASGFNSLEHFATAFRQRHKVSPSHYRKQGR